MDSFLSSCLDCIPCLFGTYSPHLAQLIGIYSNIFKSLRPLLELSHAELA